MSGGINEGRNFRIRNPNPKLYSTIARLVVTLTDSVLGDIDVVVPLTTTQCSVQQNDTRFHVQGYVAWSEQGAYVAGSNPHFPTSVDMTNVTRARIVFGRVSPPSTPATGIVALDASIAQATVDAALLTGLVAGSISYQGANPAPATTLLQGRFLPGPSTYQDAAAGGALTKDFSCTTELWLAELGEVGAGLTSTVAGDFDVTGGLIFQAFYKSGSHGNGLSFI